MDGTSEGDDENLPDNYQWVRTHHQKQDTADM